MQFSPNSQSQSQSHSQSHSHSHSPSSSSQSAIDEARQDQPPSADTASESESESDAESEFESDTDSASAKVTAAAASPSGHSQPRSLPHAVSAPADSATDSVSVSAPISSFHSSKRLRFVLNLNAKFLLSNSLVFASAAQIRTPNQQTFQPEPRHLTASFNSDRALVERRIEEIRALKVEPFIPLKRRRVEINENSGSGSGTEENESDEDEAEADGDEENEVDGEENSASASLTDSESASQPGSSELSESADAGSASPVSAEDSDDEIFLTSLEREKEKPVDQSRLTIRQRAAMKAGARTEFDEQENQPMSLSLSSHLVPLSEDQLAKRELNLARRRDQAKESKERLFHEAIAKLLDGVVGADKKRRLAEKQKEIREAKRINNKTIILRYDSSRDSPSLLVPPEEILSFEREQQKRQKQNESSRLVHCSVSNCGKIKKFTEKSSNRPFCDYQCWNQYKQQQINQNQNQHQKQQQNNEILQPKQIPMSNN